MQNFYIFFLFTFSSVNWKGEGCILHKHRGWILRFPPKVLLSYGNGHLFRSEKWNTVFEQTITALSNPELLLRQEAMTKLFDMALWWKKIFLILSFLKWALLLVIHMTPFGCGCLLNFLSGLVSANQNK